MVLRNSNRPPKGHFMFSSAVTRDDLRRHLSQGRTYVWPPNHPEAERYVSVTTALDAVPKPFLPRWSAKLVAETAVYKRELFNSIADDDEQEAINWLKGAPWSSRDRAANSGTAIHRVVELDAEGRSDEADELLATLHPSARQKATNARHFFSQPGIEVEMVEFVVYNDSLGYAGTGDFIVKLPFALPDLEGGLNPTVILDVKTGNGVYPEVALQLAAYRYSEWVVDLANAERLETPPVDGGVVLWPKENGWELIPVQCGPDVFEQFKAVLALSQHVPLDPGLVGTPMQRGAAT